MSGDRKFKAALIGCGGMGRNQAKILHAHDDYELVGVCDTVPENLQAAVEATGATGFDDFARMLAETGPDVVAVTTGNSSHAALTVQAAEAGVKAVHCEKPMAVSLDEARRMISACSKNDVGLIVNHQRRLGADLATMRDLIADGAIGEVYLVRTQNAGDLLSDGTHAIDSLRFILGDPMPDRVSGHIELHDEPTNRYGHPVDAGAILIGTMNKIRFEVLTGTLREGSTAYQDYEVVGTRGRLLRTGDRDRPNLFISDGGPGDRKIFLNPWPRRPLDRPMPWPSKDGGEHPAPPDDDRPAPWRAIETDRPAGSAIGTSYTRLAEILRTDRDFARHPMNGDTALIGFELVMAGYESARRRRPVTFPLGDDFPSGFPLLGILDQSA